MKAPSQTRCGAIAARGLSTDRISSGLVGRCFLNLSRGISPGPPISRARESFQHFLGRLIPVAIRPGCGGMTTSSNPSCHLRRSSSVRIHSPFGARSFPSLNSRQRAAIRGPVGRVSQDVRRTVDEDESAADEQPRGLDSYLPLYLLQAVVEAYHSSESIAVGDTDRGKTVARCCDREFLRTGSAAQKRIVRGDGNFCIGSHAKIPCMNQRAAAVSRP